MSETRGRTWVAWCVAIVALFAVLLAITLFVPFIPCPCVGRPLRESLMCHACDGSGWTSLVKTWRASGDTQRAIEATQPGK